MKYFLTNQFLLQFMKVINNITIHKCVFMQFLMVRCRNAPLTQSPVDSCWCFTALLCEQQTSHIVTGPGGISGSF